MQERNPLLEPENYYKQYEDSINKLRNDPSVIEFDKITYELFSMNEMGKRWLELVTERYLIPGMGRMGTATFQIDIIWGEGFKEFIRLILTSIKSHQQRIISGK